MVGDIGIIGTDVVFLKFSFRRMDVKGVVDVGSLNIFMFKNFP